MYPRSSFGSMSLNQRLQGRVQMVPGLALWPTAPYIGSMLRQGVISSGLMSQKWGIFRGFAARMGVVNLCTYVYKCIVEDSMLEYTVSHIRGLIST